MWRLNYRYRSPHTAIMNVGSRFHASCPSTSSLAPLRAPQYTIDWKQWNQQDIDSNAHNPTLTLGSLADEWFAGAEIELIQRHGLEYDEADAHRGMGRASTFVQSRSRGKYRNAAGDLGLMGQRLAWTGKALWTIIVAMSSPLHSPTREKYINLAKTMAPRALAFRRELAQRSGDREGLEYISIISGALRAIGKAGLRVRGIPPLLQRLQHVDHQDKLDDLKARYNAIDAAPPQRLRHEAQKIPARCEVVGSRGYRQSSTPRHPTT